MSKIQLQVGKRYVRRDGQITGALALHDDLFIDSNTTLTWHSGGNYFITEESAFDLISEYTEPILTNTAMTLDELRKRATAAELTLIDTVIKLMDEEAVKTVRTRAGNFLRANPVPARDNFGEPLYSDQMVTWCKRFNEALTDEVK